MGAATVFGLEAVSNCKRGAGAPERRPPCRDPLWTNRRPARIVAAVLFSAGCIVSAISVIVPTFNRKDYLLEALAALQQQTRPVSQIIVWDDGSSDGTHAAVAALSDPRLQYCRAENAGKAAALNAALELADGDYIWICDDDDIALPDAAEQLAGLLDAHPEAGVAGGCYNRFRDGPEGREVTGPGYWPDLSTGTPLRHLLEDIFLFQNATLVRRACYGRTGPFREDLPRSIDYDMIVRLAVRFPIRMTSQKLFLQRKHDGLRGPAGHRHAASAADSVWAQQDKVVFQGLRDHLPLSLMEAMFSGASRAHLRRAACLQRGGAFARHNLWQDALSDFEAAAAAEPAAPLAAVETAICRRAVSGKHGVAFGPDDRRRLNRLRSSGAAGRAIAASLGRGLLWSLRRAAGRGNPAETLRLARMLAATGLRLRGGAQDSRLRENSILSAAAYTW